jgi:OMF family outer membrane factor
VKGQKLFHSFLPGVTVAVLTTQPAWSQTIDLSLISSGDVSTSLDNTSLEKSNINIKQPIALTPETTTDTPKSASSEVSLRSNTNLSVEEIIKNAQGVVFNLTPISGLSHQPDTSHFISWEKSQSPVASGSKAQLASSIRLSTQKKNPQTQLLSVSEMPVKRTSAAKLLHDEELCPTKLLSGVGKCVKENNRVAQRNTTNPKVPTQQSVPTPQSNPQVPTTTPPAPTNTTPVVPTIKPTNAGPSIQVPGYLNANPNPLQFPTKPQEVRIVGTQPITLAQALEIARRNNRDLQVSLLTLQKNQYVLQQAQAALLPSFSLSADVTRGRSATSTLTQRQNERAGLPSSDPTSSSFTGGATLSYDLFTSGRRSASIRQAEELVRYYQLDVERQSEVIRLNVTSGYYDLQSADEQVRIYQASVRNYEASLRDALALERAGVGTRFDVLQAQVQLANAQQNLTNALSTQRTSRRQFAQILSIPQSVDISAADPVELAGLWNRNLEETIILAFQNRPELQQFISQRNQAEQRRRINLAQLGPQVSLVAQYNLLDVFNDSFGISDGYSVGLNTRVNLFDGGAARAQANQERINIRIADTQFGIQRDQIRFDVENYYSQLQANLVNVQTSTVALSQAREALRLARLRFQAGVGTQTDVITQEAALTSAEGNRVTAILNYNRALANLQRAVTSRAFR